jgi:hypothetical protein
VATTNADGPTYAVEINLFVSLHFHLCPASPS